MTPRYKLRTLLILLAILPPVLAAAWGRYESWKAAERLRRAQRITWMIGPTTDLSALSILPQTVGELEDWPLPSYVGIDGALLPETRRPATLGRP
jgi:hypothetical protein